MFHVQLNFVACIFQKNKLYFLPQKSAHIIKSPGHDYFTIDDVSMIGLTFVREENAYVMRKF